MWHGRVGLLGEDCGALRHSVMASRWRCAAPAWREGLQGARQPTQRFSGTASVCWAAPAPTRSALRALDECAELLRPSGWLLCGRETTAVWHADGAERLSAAERRQKIFWAP